MRAKDGDNVSNDLHAVVKQFTPAAGWHGGRDATEKPAFVPETAAALDPSKISAHVVRASIGIASTATVTRIFAESGAGGTSTSATIVYASCLTSNLATRLTRRVAHDRIRRRDHTLERIDNRRPGDLVADQSMNAMLTRGVKRVAAHGRL